MGKREKRKRKKRLEKQIQGLEEQREKHQEKLEFGVFREDFRKDTTPEYWIGEIKNLLEQKMKKRELLEKLLKKKEKP